MNTRIADILTGSQIVPELRATDRWQAIDELLDRLTETGAIKPGQRDVVAQAVRKREQSMSTGIGFGIGIPHATTEAISDAVAAFGRSKRGINFDALDGKPVRFVLLFLVPPGQFQKHLHTLAGVAKLLHNESFRTALEQVPDAATMLQIIRAQEDPHHHSS
jgi:mannitol/fructose-specific phosphotransferase system IIA component (Ntr-type)